jgi:hypothetical protein
MVLAFIKYQVIVYEESLTVPLNGIYTSCHTCGSFSDMIIQPFHADNYVAKGSAVSKFWPVVDIERIFEIHSPTNAKSKHL